MEKESAEKNHVRTAYHEAAHVVAFREKGCKVSGVCIYEDESGVTKSRMPHSIEDIVLIVLVGMTAEFDQGTAHKTVLAFLETYAAAGGDRELISTVDQEWLSRSSNSLWPKVQYNKATKFCQDHAAGINAIAEAILAKPAFPKCLTESEIDGILGRRNCYVQSV